MTLDDAKAQLEALTGVYDVSVFVRRNDLDARPKYVKFSIRIASPKLLPEKTRQGIVRIQDALEQELGCFVSVSVSAGLRMPNWTGS